LKEYVYISFLLFQFCSLWEQLPLLCGHWNKLFFIVFFLPQLLTKWEQSKNANKIIYSGWHMHIIWFLGWTLGYFTPQSCWKLSIVSHKFNIHDLSIVFSDWCTHLTFKGFWVLFQMLALIPSNKTIKISVIVVSTIHLTEGLEPAPELYLSFQDLWWWFLILLSLGFNTI
jgi:hypothetical protein